MRAIILTTAAIIAAFTIGCSNNPVNNVPVVEDTIVGDIIFDDNPKDTFVGDQRFELK